MDECPSSDPAIGLIRADFDIRRDGVPVTQFTCVGPYTQTPLTQFSLETVVLQFLRILYYLDSGRSGYLPWTNLRLYDWVKSKIAGIDIRTDSAVSACCETINGQRYMIYSGTARDDNNKAYLLNLPGLLANLALVAHEARHVEGFPHVSCCGISGGCDQTYDEKNLSPYGIQYYLQRAWLTGVDLNVNLACLDPAGLGPVSFDIRDANLYASRFCDTKPTLIAKPAVLGGSCQPGPYPYIAPGGIANVANNRADAIAPGSAVALYGLGLAGTTGQAGGSPFPTTLGNVSVKAGSTPAPLFFVSPGQVNVQIPYETPVGSVPLMVTANGNKGFRRYTTVKAAAPALFTTADDFVIAQNQDFTLITTDQPARIGTTVTIYFTGQGLSDNAVATGTPAPADPLSRPLASAGVTIGGIAQTVAFAGLTPGFVGLSQANVAIVSTTPTGTQPIVLTLGSAASAPTRISIAK